MASFFVQSITPPILKGLVGWWRFNELTGSVVKESMFGRATLNYSNNTVTRSFFQNEPALTFTNGTDGGVTTTVSPPNFPTGQNPRTLCGWINPYSNASTSNDGAFMSLGTTGSGQTFTFTPINLNGTYYIFTDSVNVGNNMTCLLSQLPPAGVWSHIALTFDGGSAWAYYVNGVLIKNGTFGVTINTTQTGIEIGTRYNSAVGQKTIGESVANMRLYNRALSATELLILYNNKQ